jgi:hypothetical protein
MGGFSGLVQHDHGWAGCNKKKYFIRRARRVLRLIPDNNPMSKGKQARA